MSIMNLKRLPETGRDVSRVDYNPGIQELEAFARNKTDLRFHSIFRIIFHRRCLFDIFYDNFLTVKVSLGENNVLIKFLE